MKRLVFELMIAQHLWRIYTYDCDFILSFLNLQKTAIIRYMRYF